MPASKRSTKTSFTRRSNKRVARKQLRELKRALVRKLLRKQERALARKLLREQRRRAPMLDRLPEQHLALPRQIADEAQRDTAEWIDPDDAPELTREMAERADLYHGDKLIRRGRPPSDNPKQALKLRIDADVVEHFRATGPGWQTRINDTLRRAAKLKRTASPR